jgi:hypothetical protein
MAIKKFSQNSGWKHGVEEYYGLSADIPNLPLNTVELPKNVDTASIFYAIDTKAVYMFEKESNQWYLQ